MATHATLAWLRPKGAQLTESIHTAQVFEVEVERNIPTPEQRLSVVAASERILTHLAAEQEDEAAEVMLALVDIEEECNGGLMGDARMQLRRPLPPKLLALTCALLHVQAHPHLTPSPSPVSERSALRAAPFMPAKAPAPERLASPIPYLTLARSRSPHFLLDSLMWMRSRAGPRTGGGGVVQRCCNGARALGRGQRRGDGAGSSGAAGVANDRRGCDGKLLHMSFGTAAL
jgi:hypothetical protein